MGNENAVSGKSLHLIVRIGHNLFAVDSGNIIEITEKPGISGIPYLPEKVMGVANVRGKLVPVYDMRAWFGMTGYETEISDLITMLKQREQDHRNWLSELHASITEKREFKLQLDPHKCKFGIWYDSFKTDDFDLNKLLRSFDEPHKRIHSLAKEAEGLLHSGNIDKAKELVEVTGRATLGKMVAIFEKAYGIIKAMDRRVLVITRVSGNLKGLLVDSAESTALISPGDIIEKEFPGGKSEKFVDIGSGLAELFQFEQGFI